jgi:hypothetical protein
MVYNRITGFLDFSVIRYSRKEKTRRFGNWICFRLQVSGEDILSWAELSRCLLPLHLRMETDPVSEASCFLFSRIPDDRKSPKTQ